MYLRTTNSEHINTTISHSACFTDKNQVQRDLTATKKTIRSGFDNGETSPNKSLQSNKLPIPPTLEKLHQFRLIEQSMKSKYIWSETTNRRIFRY